MSVVRKPMQRNKKWVVQLAKDKSPLSEVIDEAFFDTYEAAMHGYRIAKKELGEWY